MAILLKVNYQLSNIVSFSCAAGHFTSVKDVPAGRLCLFLSLCFWHRNIFDSFLETAAYL